MSMLFHVSYRVYKEVEHIKRCVDLLLANDANSLLEYVDIQPEIASETFTQKVLAIEFINSFPSNWIFYSLSDGDGNLLVKSPECQRDYDRFSGIFNFLLAVSTRPRNPQNNN